MIYFLNDLKIEQEPRLEKEINLLSERKNLVLKIRGNGSYTDGNNVNIGMDIPNELKAGDLWFDERVERKLIKNMYQGLMVHESGHVNFTSFKKSKAWIDSKPKNLQGIFHHIANILEDGRIEFLMSYKFKVSSYIRLINKILRVKPFFEKMMSSSFIEVEDDINLAQNTILMLSTCYYYDKDFVDEFPKLKKFFDGGMYELIDTCHTNITYDEILYISDKVVEKLIEVYGLQEAQNADKNIGVIDSGCGCQDKDCEHNSNEDESMSDEEFEKFLEDIKNGEVGDYEYDSSGNRTENLKKSAKNKRFNISKNEESQSGKKIKLTKEQVEKLKEISKNIVQRKHNNIEQEEIVVTLTRENLLDIKNLSKFFSKYNQLPIKITDKKTGVLNTKVLSRVGTYDDKIFKRTKNFEKKSAAITIMIDGSGSMQTEERYIEVARTASIIEASIKDKFPMRVVRYTDFVDVLKSFSDKSYKDRLYSTKALASGCNNEKIVLENELAELKKRSELKKIAFIINDGIPNTQTATLQKKIAEYKENGIHLIAVFVGKKSDYPDFKTLFKGIPTVFSESKQMTKKIQKILTQII